MSGYVPMRTEGPAQGPAANGRAVALAVHALYAASLLVGVSSLVGLVVAYMKRPDLRGTMWEGHMTYAIRTFWIGLLLGLVGVLLLHVLIGAPLLVLTGVWFIVRVVRAGLLALDSRPIPKPAGFR